MKFSANRQRYTMLCYFPELHCVCTSVHRDSNYAPPSPPPWETPIQARMASSGGGLVFCVRGGFLSPDQSAVQVPSEQPRRKTDDVSAPSASVRRLFGPNTAASGRIKTPRPKPQVAVKA